MVGSWYWQTVTHIDYPFDSVVHRDAAWLEDEIIAWCLRHRLIRTAAQEQQVRAALLAEFVARANADLPRPQLRLVALWTVWFFLADDITDTSRSPELLAYEHLRALRVVSGGGGAGGSDMPLINAVEDLQAQLRQYASSVSLMRFQRAFAQTLEAQVWEAGNYAADRQPDRGTYNVMRLWSGAFFPMIALVDVVRGFTLPPHIYSHALVQEIIEEASRAVLWYNDLWSYPKEAATGAARHNIVAIIMREQGVGLEDALEIAVEEHESSLQRMLELRAELSCFGADEPAARRFVDGIAAWLRATQDWSHRTPRYQLERAAAV
jgi:hypothetical protein